MNTSTSPTGEQNSQPDSITEVLKQMVPLAPEMQKIKEELQKRLNLVLPKAELSSLEQRAFLLTLQISVDKDLLKTEMERREDLFFLEYLFIEGIYLHVKSGRRYMVTDVTRCSETNQILVCYRDIDNRNKRFTRPAWQFLESVEVNGVKGPRFGYLHGGFEAQLE